MKNSYRDTARDLKRLGLVTYDLRKPLSSGQKSQITKLRQTWGHAIKAPEAFHKARVSDKRAKELKAAGFKVTPRGVAFIPLSGHDSARIEKGAIVYRSRDGVSEKTFLTDHKHFFSQLRSLMDTPLPKNTMVTVRIGDRNPFKRRLNSYAELYYYLENDFEPNDDGENKAHLFSLMSIVYGPKTKPSRAKAKKKAAIDRTKEGWKIDPVTGEIKIPNAKKKAPAKKKRRN